jgi:hypothetical protein
LLALSTPEKIAAVQDLLDAFRGDKSAQQNLSKDNELARHDRDELLNVLNTLALPLTRPAEMSIRKHECVGAGSKLDFSPEQN